MSVSISLGTFSSQIFSKSLLVKFIVTCTVFLLSFKIISSIHNDLRPIREVSDSALIRALVSTNTQNVEKIVNMKTTKSKVDIIFQNQHDGAVLERANSRIPFYIYDSPEINWYTNCLTTFPWLNYSDPSNINKQWYYHSDDFIFIEKILNHPWRTYNPEDAQVFVLPTLFAFFSGFAKHPAPDPEKEPQLNLKYGYAWNIENLTCNGKNFDKLMDDTLKFLDGSEVYQKYGNLKKDPENYRTHLIVNSHFFFNRRNTQEDMFFNHMSFLDDYLPNFSIGTFEAVTRWNFGGMEHEGYRQMMTDRLDRVVEKRPWRCSVIVPYVEAKWSYGEHSNVDKKLKDTKTAFKNWKKREYDFFFVGRMGHKLSYQTRRVISESLELVHQKMLEKGKEAHYLMAESHNPVIPYQMVGQKEKPNPNEDMYRPCKFSDCVNLKRCASCQLNRGVQTLHNQIGLDSKFALIIHGDSSTTSRLYDAIYNGLIPIIISPTIFKDGLPFESIVPWKDMSFNLPIASINNLVDKNVMAQNLYNILNYPEDILEHKFKRLVEIRKDVSWLHPESRIVENILRDAKNECTM